MRCLCEWLPLSPVLGGQEVSRPAPSRGRRTEDLSLTASSSHDDMGDLQSKSDTEEEMHRSQSCSDLTAAPPHKVSQQARERAAPSTLRCLPCYDLLSIKTATNLLFPSLIQISPMANCIFFHPIYPYKWFDLISDAC